MFPWLAHGHISPFLELAKSLATRNFISYICSSPINLNSIKKTLSPKDSISIKFVELQIPTTQELPPHYHTTNGLPPHLMGALKRTFDKAQPAFSTLLKTLKPDLVIYDFLQSWAPEEAALQDIPAVLFLSTSAAATSLMAYHWFEAESEYPFPEVHFRENEYGIFSRLIKCTGSDTNEDERVRLSVQRSSDIVLIKTFRELEGKYMDYLSDLARKRFVPVGPLVHNSEEKQSDHFIGWLEGKDEKSTIFASFGSEYFLSDHEIEEIACGLEMSGVNFIWVLRFPVGDRIRIEEKLPVGFLERVWGRGMVVEGWAPQRQILSHRSVGGFLSHCGWSSVMEGVYFGVPIVALPMNLDQPLNARVVVPAGVGEEVVRNREGKLDRTEVARVVRKVVVEESGEEVRRRVAEMGGKIREKGEVEIEGVVEEVVRLCRRERWEIERENSMDSLMTTDENSNRDRMLSENT
ncbi:UDP-glucuronosyl and UDP-glucosyl transferase [Handroanthus impetiginosus]|uniref:Glycosyltransferase n=1 Tax=Handroanthus impetiginosus TaxID=429701 RepID=A0A2G9GFC2_9LAMI|nr:UDP-glucuronosyl and UDP-glucosyl transferase [Handroanthus impetiginosus]